jgi:uncharacterized repeat protein (TIGR02543 family)
LRTKGGKQMKYHLKEKYRLKVNAFLVKQFKIWCSVLLVITGSSYMLKNAYADNNSGPPWNIGVAGQEDSVVADYADGTLTISGNGTMKVILPDAILNDIPWYGYKNNITKVIIDGNITATSLRGMFRDLTNLKTIEGLDKIDTSHVTNMFTMFYNCNSLTKLDISNFDTSNVTDMSSMFYKCQALTELDISNFDTNNVTDMSSMFHNCKSLTELDLSSFNTSQVTDMSYMFCNCQALTELDLSSFNTSQVAKMNYMFDSCKALTELNVSNFKTSNVTAMNSMFGDCQSLAELNISSFSTNNVTSMFGMFYNCQSLTELDLSNFDTNNVIDMTAMFNSCQSLIELDISSFNTRNVIYMGSMLYNCQSLVTIKGLDISKEDCEIDSMFDSTLNLSQIQVKTKKQLEIPYIDSVHKWYDEDDQILKDNDRGTAAVIPVSSDFVTYTLEPTITHSIIYELDGGVLPDDAQDKFEILGEYELPIPTKSGYIFAGWYDSVDFDRSITKIEKNTTKDMTVYAKWIGKTAIKADDFKVELSSETYTGNEITYTITSLLEGVGTTQVKKIEKNGVEVSKVKEAGTYKMTFDVAESDKYKSATVTKTFTILQATNSWKDELQIENWTYGEEAKKPTSEAEFGEVKYTYSDKQDGVFTDKVPTDAGTWYVKATVEGTDNYKGIETTKDFSIYKAKAPDVTESENLSGVQDNKLSTVTLSKGWTWVDGNIMLSVQNGGYNARLIVDDTNYDYTGVEGYNKENHYVERTLNVSVTSKEAGSIQKEVKKGNNAPDVKIPMSESQLANIVLTDDEKKAVEKGSDIKIVLTVDDATGQISIKDKTVIESVLGKMKIGQYLDVSLLKIIDHKESKISQTRGVIRITIEIPESLRKANREFVMIRVHDGVVTILKDMDNDANTITIETDRFSTYAIAYQDKQSDIAETEDRTVIGGYIILAGLSGMLLFINRKQKRI